MPHCLLSMPMDCPECCLFATSPYVLPVCAQPTGGIAKTLFRKRAEADLPRVVMSGAAQWTMTLCRATVWERLEA